MNETEHLLDVALAVQRLARDNPKHLIPQSPRAKRLLEDVFTALRTWEARVEEENRKGNEVGRCVYCNAELIMATPTEEDELVAFEAESILAAGLPPSYNWQIDFGGAKPIAHINLGMRTGTVWIMHAEACGSLSKPGLNHAVYRRRHSYNQAHVGEAKTNLTRSLKLKLQQLRDSAEELEHDD